ncbi:hypothetical protein [Streptomyces sp. SA15]|uniref:hypothetical protein n=1 Tax=Streptomyces sp. SA15 TaxID=934019 RepID=UPI001180AC51|nr:hypothetical protein [Streptomyces sp. SA15]
MVLALAALAAWRLWPADTEPAVAVPERVCGGKLPGTLAAEVLPSRGAAFEEETENGFEPPQPGGPECRFSAGGRGVTVWYMRLVDAGSGLVGQWTRKFELRAGQSGFDPLTLGGASGYSGSHSAGITFSCPSADDKGVLVISVEGRGFPEKEDAGIREGFAALAGETLRVAAQDIVKCEAAGQLPGDPPVIDH